MGSQRRYEEDILREIKKLPAEQAREVLDFAVFLRHQVERERDRVRGAREEAARRMEARRRRIGPIGIDAADLVEEGRAARAAAILREEETR